MNEVPNSLICLNSIGMPPITFNQKHMQVSVKTHSINFDNINIDKDVILTKPNTNNKQIEELQT